MRAEVNGWKRLFSPTTIEPCVLVRGSRCFRCCSGLFPATELSEFSPSHSSMEPTIKQGEQVAAEMRSLQPQRGDLVVFDHDGALLVKRVIAIPGDVVEGRDLKIIVNGKVQEEPYVQHTGNQPLGIKTLETFAPITVSKDHVFVAGDNRDYSFDSRDPRFGLVAVSDVRGKPLRIVNSPDVARRGMSLK
jgi:signal peptidase I